MKQKIILEHRQALDEMEEARGKYHTCKHTKKQCDNGNNCITCPAALNYQAKKVVFDEKAAALQQINEQTIKRNDKSMTIEKEKRLEKRAKRTMGQKQVPIYNRDELTVEKYKKHSLEGLTDREIQELYGFPPTSFDKWKRENNLSKRDIKAKKQKTVPKEAVTVQTEVDYKQQYEQIKVIYDDLFKKHLKLQQDLGAANRKKAEKQKALALTEENLRQARETATAFEQEIESLAAERDHYKEQADFHAGMVEELQAQMAALAEEDEEDDRMETIKKQFQLFDQWETMLLTRVLQLKRPS